MKKKHILPLIFVLLAYSNLNFAHGITTKSLLKTLERLEKTIVGSAELMSEDNYSFSPFAPVRNFEKQMLHTAGANYLFCSILAETKNPFNEPSSLTKPEVIAILKESFKYSADVIKKLSDEDLNQKVKFFNGELDRVTVILKWMDHQQREHGKTIMYLRAKGIKPPSSKGW